MGNPGDVNDAWAEYSIYGGLPLVLGQETEDQKSRCLMDLYKRFYLKDIADRHNLRENKVLAEVIKGLALAVGTLTNPAKLSGASHRGRIHASDKTIGNYIGYLLDDCFIRKAVRYDVKGKKYIDSP